MDVLDVLKNYQDAEFSYGRLDCCLFVANVIRELTGKDPAAPWRGSYKSELEALMILAEYGGLAALAGAVFGRLRPAWEVTPGDPVLLDPVILESDSINAGLGIFDGDQVVYLTDQGLARASILAARGCWHD